MQKIILASASPRRRSLLQAAGYDVTVLPSTLDESGIERKSPTGLVKALAALKGGEIAALYSDEIVIAADTIVYLNGSVIGKPTTGNEAAQLLQRLSGCTHSVYTGVFMSCNGVSASFYDRTDVTFRKLNDHQIQSYIQSGAPFDKAGGYGIQDHGIYFISSVKGDITNVIGLPMDKTEAHLALFRRQT